MRGTRDNSANTVERLLERGSAVGLSEGRLVERFAERRDEAAFAALVDRHGPMVLGVCRRLLRDPNDADDAFQAVFLVLARKAGGLRRKERVANWLYGVALRVAMEARKRPRATVADDASAFDADARRPAPADPAALVARREDEARLHEEVGRLPERYRAAVVACYFEGRTHEEAAALLDWPIGTVKGRLARARDLLRARLERRGATAPLATLAAPGLRVAVPPALASRAVAAALAAVASPSAWMASAAVSTTALALSEGVIQAMFHAHVKSCAIFAALALGLLAVGGLATAGRDAPQTPDPAGAAKPEAARAARELGPMEVAKLVGETASYVQRKISEFEADYLYYAPTSEADAARAVARFRGDARARIDELRAARVADPAARALLDALGDVLSPMLKLGNAEDPPREAHFEYLETLRDGYFLFDRHARHARREAGADPSAREGARARFRSGLAGVLDFLRRNPKEEGTPKPLPAVFADYLETIDPFAADPPAAVVEDAEPGPEAAAPAGDARELGPMEVATLVGETAATVFRIAREAEVDSAYNIADRGETIRIRDRLAKDVAARAAALRSARVAEPKGRALLDAFARALELPPAPGGGKDLSKIPLQDARLISEVQFVFDQAALRAREEVARDPAARGAALVAFRFVLAPAAEHLRNPKEDGATRPLLTAYADYLESVDPFAEAPAPARASGDRSDVQSVMDALTIVWQAADRYQKSYETATQFDQPATDEEQAAAMARHLDRARRLADDARERAGGDPLPLSLADYLDAHAKTSVTASAQSVPTHTLGLLRIVHSKLDPLIEEARSAADPDSNEFDRELARERLARGVDRILAESSRLPETDEAARELVDRHAEYVRKLFRDNDFLFPPQPRRRSPSP